MKTVTGCVVVTILRKEKAIWEAHPPMTRCLRNCRLRAWLETGFPLQDTGASNTE